MYLSITFELFDLQRTAAPNFGVASGALAYGHVKIDLSSSLAARMKAKEAKKAKAAGKKLPADKLAKRAAAMAKKGGKKGKK